MGLSKEEKSKRRKERRLLKKGSVGSEIKENLESPKETRLRKRRENYRKRRKKEETYNPIPKSKKESKVKLLEKPEEVSIFEKDPLKTLDETKSLIPPEVTTKRFIDQHKELTKLIGSEASDFRTDQATQAVLRALTTSILNTIPIAEAQFHEYKNDRAAYAFNALVNQARELLNDLRNFQDLDQQVQHIVIRIIQPSFTLIVNMLVQELTIFKESLTSNISDSNIKPLVNSEITKLIQNYSKYLSEILKDIEDKIEKYLIDQSTPSKSKRK